MTVRRHCVVAVSVRELLMLCKCSDFRFHFLISDYRNTWSQPGVSTFSCSSRCRTNCCCSNNEEAADRSCRKHNPEKLQESSFYLLISAAYSGAQFLSAAAPLSITVSVAPPPRLSLRADWPAAVR